MHTERTRDRVILTAKEVQEILKSFIEAKTGRAIEGDVIFQKSNGVGGNGTSETTAYAHLKYEEIKYEKLS